MKNKLSLAIAAATVSLAALTGSVMILSDRASAQDDGTALSDGDKAFLKVVPMSPGPETAGLVPHAGPEEAAAVAKAFFDHHVECRDSLDAPLLLVGRIADGRQPTYS